MSHDLSGSRPRSGGARRIALRALPAPGLGLTRALGLTQALGLTRGLGLTRALGLTRGLGLTRALGLTLIALACLAPVAGADPNAGEAVTALLYRAGAGGVPLNDTATVGTLETGCPVYAGPNIELHESDGSLTPGQQISALAWSLGTLLHCLPVPIPLSAVTGITVLGANGPELRGAPELSELSPGDLASPSDFANAAEDPIVYSDGTGVIYDRPWRGGDDANADDQVVEAAPAPFVFEVFEGPLLHIGVSASATRVPAGGTVSFSASISGEPAGSPLTYGWDFDGGAPASATPAPAVTFPAAGSYRVTLQVTDGDGGGGAATIPITVSSGTATTPTTAQGSSPTGPTRSAGSQPGAQAGRHTSGTSTTTGTHHATSSGARRGDAGHSPGEGTANASSAGSGSAGSATRSSATRSSATRSSATASAPTTSAPTASAPTASAPTTGATTTAATTAPARAGRPSDARTPPTPGDAPTAGSGPLVAGRLISDVTLLPATASPLVRGPQAGAPSAPALHRALGAALGPALGAAVALLLFGLGAGREWRGRRMRRPLRLHG